MNQAKKRLRNVSYIPFRYQRWPRVLFQPSWTSSNNIFQSSLLTLRIAKIATDMHNTSLYTSCLNLLLATCLHSTIIVSSYSQQQVSIIYLNTLMVSSNSDQQV